MVPDETPVSDDATRIVYTGSMSILNDIMALPLSDLSRETLDECGKVFCKYC